MASYKVIFKPSVVIRRSRLYAPRYTLVFRVAYHVLRRGLDFRLRGNDITQNAM